jgi:hypothetical protein
MTHGAQSINKISVIDAVEHVAGPISHRLVVLRRIKSEHHQFIRVDEIRDTGFAQFGCRHRAHVADFGFVGHTGMSPRNRWDQKNQDALRSKCGLPRKSWHLSSAPDRAICWSGRIPIFRGSSWHSQGSAVWSRLHILENK